MRRLFPILLLSLVCAAYPLNAQSSFGVGYAYALGSKDDPGYKLYKAGYNLILNEKWQEARTKLAEVAKRFEKWLARKGEPCATNRTWREHLKDHQPSQMPLLFIEVYEEARFGAADGARLSELREMIQNLETHSGGHHG